MWEHGAYCDIEDKFTGVTAIIQNGKFSLAIGIPKTEEMRLLKTGYSMGNAITSANKETVEGFIFWDVGETTHTTYLAHYLSGVIIFIYVEQTVTVNGVDDSTSTWDNVTLQPGWNSVSYKSGTYTNVTDLSPYRWEIY